ncbi:hypothetical protein NP493_267g00021 [Ridgeia piscesae]|uniref:Tether containing UBX domain for GLUT4 n=1 Tax=Ridgeia piscesae TaxID=27915 RepID=A0AAD9UCM3_RIDPI|nr:hypothetical protein NP493_267g00021 [Ridgeia piscesae]
MSTKVEVLCPNGHRVNIKVTPTTKILQILEEACTKQGFLPPEEYELRHSSNKRPIDVTLSMRFAGIPNHAKLELVKSNKSRTESDVVIALQLESGERLQHAFPPSTALWDVLGYWEDQPESTQRSSLRQAEGEGIHPVCIYMQEEVLGEYALRERSLRSLGLTGGKAIIRLVHRAVDAARLAHGRHLIEVEKSRLARLTALAQQKDRAVRTDTLLPSSMDVDADSTVSHADTDMTSESVSMSSVPEVEVSKETRSEPVIRQDDPSLHRAHRTARSIDVVPEVEAMDMTDEQQQFTQRLVQLSSMTAPGAYAGMAVDDRDSEADVHRHSTSRQPQLPFANFKFPESTRGMDLYHNEFSVVQKKDFEPCDREKIVFSLDENVLGATSDTDLPDDFFEVTEADVKMMYTDMQRKLKEELSKPLVTRSLRLAEIEAKMAKYDRATIRVTFPDRLVLQGLFRPQETVYALQKFVKEHLEDKEISFYLYISPPKVVLKDSAKTLIEVGLVPMSVVYFGSETRQDHYLAMSVYEGRTSRHSATEVLMKNLPSTSGQQSDRGSAVVGGATGRTAATQNIAATRGSKHSYDTDPGSKVPKWFKIGQFCVNTGHWEMIT